MSSRLLDEVMIMFGREPKKPVQISERAQQMHALKRITNKEELKACK